MKSVPSYLRIEDRATQAHKAHNLIVCTQLLLWLPCYYVSYKLWSLHWCSTARVFRQTSRQVSPANSVRWVVGHSDWLVLLKTPPMSLWLVHAAQIHAYSDCVTKTSHGIINSASALWGVNAVLRVWLRRFLLQWCVKEIGIGFLTRMCMC